MCDLVVFFFVLQTKILGKAMQIGWLGGSEVPVREAFLVAVQIGQAIFAQDRRRVVFGVETDGQQMGLAVVAGSFLEFLMNQRKLAAQARTEIRHGAARVDESDK